MKNKELLYKLNKEIDLNDCLLSLCTYFRIHNLEVVSLKNGKKPRKLTSNELMLLRKGGDYITKIQNIINKG